MLVDPREDKWGKYWNLMGCAFLNNESTVDVGEENRDLERFYFQ